MWSQHSSAHVASAATSRPLNTRVAVFPPTFSAAAPVKIPHHGLLALLAAGAVPPPPPVVRSNLT